MHIYIIQLLNKPIKTMPMKWKLQNTKALLAY